MSWTRYWASGGHAQQPRYGQFSYKNCAVGCGPVAWGILFGWADRQADLGNSYWAPRWGIYRENGGRGSNAVAPLTMDGGVQNMIQELRDHMGTFCVPGGQAATFPWNMHKANDYLVGRTGARVTTNYSNIGRSKRSCRDNARNSIRFRKTPAVIGTGWLKHYPIAYGYRWRERIVRGGWGPFSWTRVETDRYFYVNEGQWGIGNGWVEASTWFSGELYP